MKINQEDATWDDLQGRLTDIFKTRAEKVMFVKGDDNIPFPMWPTSLTSPTPRASIRWA